MPRDGTATRNRIMDAAQQMVLDVGLSGTSVEKVISEAGVTRGTFFYHFKTKHDLAAALIARYASEDQHHFQDFMEKAVTLDAKAVQENGEIILDLTLINDNTGHKVPTDSPLRNLLLVITALDQEGNPLPQIAGTQLPDWAGVDQGQSGHYGGLPGKGYALILRETWTGISPTAAYWNPVQIVEDTRLAPFQEDLSQYRFQVTEEGLATITVQLIFRRAFIEIAEQKGWGVEDLVLKEIVLEVE